MDTFFLDTIGHNVIGELTGTEFPGEYITVGGHLDSWDPAAEGAHDDGAGIVHNHRSSSCVQGTRVQTKTHDSVCVICQ